MPQFETETQTKGHVAQQQRTYEEIVSYLDQNWNVSKPNTIKKINLLLGDIASKLSSIIVSGTNGKSTTMYYLSELLKTEGLQIGTFSSPHFTYYNERIAINNRLIPNDIFTDLANEVINLTIEHNISATSRDILTAMGLLYFHKQGVDVAVLELEELDNFDPITICTPQILSITRVMLQEDLSTDPTIDKIIKFVKPNTYVISADQSKLSLQVMAQKTKDKKGNWIMPIRKLAPLPYPYEQLHGRCAALAERIAQTYVEHVYKSSTTTTSLFSTQKKQRGRPRLSSQKQQTPQKTLSDFWNSIDTDTSNRFELVHFKKKRILLDNASNIDAMHNLFLGIRLLNYKKPFKNITFLFGCYKEQLDTHEFIKALRYFFKKTSVHLSFCPVSNKIGEQVGTNWDAEKIATFAQNSKLQASAYKDFRTAYSASSKHFDEEQDLLVITGSQTIISEFLTYKKEK